MGEGGVDKKMGGRGGRPLTIFTKKLRLRCLIGSSYTSDLGISSTCIFRDYSAHLLEFIVCIINDYDCLCSLQFSHLVHTHDFHFALESFTKKFHKMRGW